MWPFDMFSKKVKYVNPEEFTYRSERYGKSITIPKFEPSDGATMAPDLNKKAFTVHDRICKVGKWDDETPITNWQASTVYYDILKDSGHWQAYHRWLLTFMFGGSKLKKI